MTKEQKLEAYSMLLDGYTYQAIGEKFDVSKQHIHQVLHNTSPGYGKAMSPKYKILSQAIREKYGTYAAFSKASKLGAPYIGEVVSGKKVPNFTAILKFLKFSGLTFEEAFLIDGEEEQA